MVSSLQMNDVEAAPFLLQVFQNQTSVTACSRHLTAEKHGRDVKEFRVDPFLDRAIDQYGTEARLVFLPTEAFPAIAIQEVGRWREERFMEIFRPTQLIEKEG